MKSSFRVIAAGVILAAAMMAQRPFGVMTSATAPDPATIVAHQVARLTSLLTLTTAQAAQATTIFTAALTAVTPLEATLDTDWTALQTAVQNNAAATIDSLSANIGTLTGQIVDIQNKADAAFYATLTPAQQTILNARGGLGAHGDFGPEIGGHRH